MKRQKNSGKVLLIIAIVISFMVALGSLLATLVLAFNLWGSSDIYLNLMSQMGYVITDVTSEITVICCEMGISGLVNLFAGIKYIKIIKRGGIPMGSTPFSQVFMQMLFGSFIPCILAYIGIINFLKAKMTNRINVTKEEFHDYRMEAMTEAINRLKELKEKGAISEEEYYETLNKILES